MCVYLQFVILTSTFISCNHFTCVYWDLFLLWWAKYTSEVVPISVARSLSLYPHHKMCVCMGGILDSLCRVGQSVGRSVGPSPILVRSITPLLMEGFPSNLNDIFTSTRGCAEPMLPMCQVKVNVTVKGQIFNKQYNTLCRVRSITPLLMEDFLQTWMTHSPQQGDVQSPCCPCVSSRSMSQLNVKY